jgi:osmotically-inducible protein OsmY
MTTSKTEKPAIDPAHIRAEVQEALERHARREAERITVRVEGDAVTVAGKVDSWSEKYAILGVIRHVPGVRMVNDAIEIDPYLAHPPGRGEPEPRR